VILSSSPPASAHLAGWVLSRLTGVPWVADFRDEWAGDRGAQGQPRLRRAMDQHAERRVVAAARRVIVAAEYFRIAGASRRETIPNGVDEADVPSVPTESGDGVFRLSHVGSLYADRDVRPVLTAARRLLDRGLIDPRRFEIRVVGNVWLPEFAADSPVPLTVTGYLPHADAIREMRKAGALLLYVAPGSLAPTGKVFEYLACERPVLCVARSDNLASRLVTEWRAGACADPGDGPAIEEALASLYLRWTSGDQLELRGARERVLENYSRRALTGRLAAVLDEAARD
jgi:glycosyltransferase involved in cell wall biosynthesis